MPEETVTVRAAASTRDSVVQRFEREESVGAVGDLVEAVACAEYFEFRLLADKRLNFGERLGVVQIFGAVFDVAGPIVQFFARGPGEHGRNKRPCGHCGDGFEEGALVHDFCFFTDAVRFAADRDDDTSIKKIRNRGSRNSGVRG